MALALTSRAVETQKAQMIAKAARIPFSFRLGALAQLEIFLTLTVSGGYF
jgi:hypothetical protein